MERSRLRAAVAHAVRGQATVELAFATLILAVLVVGMVGVTEVLQAQIGLTSVAEEAAHAAALAPSVDTVEQRGQDRGAAVGNGFALRNGSLTVAIEFSRFEPGQQIRAVTTYRLTSRDVPLLMLGTVEVKREHVEVIPRFRALPAASS